MSEEQPMSKSISRETAQRGGLTTGQLDVLRQLVVNPNFRRDFATNPLRAVSTSGMKVSAAEIARLEKLSPAHLEQFSHGVNELMKAADGCTHTLVYAIIVALLLAATDRNDATLGAF
ncbi:MAG TPA: hypothetical protein VJT50_06210 [Pyrinomonadaceae bacterium]|nr:hypothetical protein [Pyrinomonadaceae bacterium]